MNSTNEWSFENHNGKAIFGTFENGVFSPNFSSGNYAVKGFSENTLTYDIHSHGMPFGTNGPSNTYFPELVGSDLTSDRTPLQTRFIFRTNNNPNKTEERGNVWQYGKGLAKPVRIPGNFSRTKFSLSPIFNRK